MRFSQDRFEINAASGGMRIHSTVFCSGGCYAAVYKVMVTDGKNSTGIMRRKRSLSALVKELAALPAVRTNPGLVRELWRAADERMQIKMEF